MTDYISYDLVEWGAPFVKQTHKQPPLPAKGVLVGITASGLCHSDLHIKKGFMDLGEEGRLTFAQRGASLPLTLGHEMAGEVEAVGSQVKDLALGQKVIIFPWIGCRACLACDEDRESDCTSMRIMGIHRNGGFASHVVVEDEKFVMDIEGLDPALMASYACSGLTVYNGLIKIGLTRKHEWLGVLGAGGLGLNAIAIARAMGFEKIIAIDIADEKLRVAREMGADKIINSSKDGAGAHLQDETDNQLFGVIDTFGSGPTARLAAGAMTKAGRYVVVGQHGGDFKIPQIWLPQKALTIRGSHVGNSGQLRELIAMFRAGQLKTIPIDVRPLSQINQAVEELKSGQVTGRIIFDPRSG